MPDALTREVGDTPDAVARSTDRVLGRVRGGKSGPMLLCIGGLHGNEPAGVLALQRVAARLEPRAGELAGDFVALLGNRPAFAARRRFMDRDLNRAWTPERLDLLRSSGRLDGEVEDREQVELLEAIEEAIEAARGPVYVMDLHTTSGFGGAFTTFGDTLPNRDFAAHIPVPMVLGLEEQVDGTLLGFLAEHGLVGVAYESGQHDEPLAVDRAEAAIWIAIGAVGLLPDHRNPEAREGRKLLGRHANGLPRALEMRYRHDIVEGNGFRMDPGWKNFQPVREGQVVGRDADGEVRVGEEGRILMPLYQEQGEDGFFLVREFRPLWLQLSVVLRRLRIDRFAHRLPGVRHDPARPDAVVVDKRVARFFALQLFHLLGFRKQEEAGDQLVLTRRNYDEARFVRRGPTPEHLT